MIPHFGNVEFYKGICIVIQLRFNENACMLAKWTQTGGDQLRFALTLERKLSEQMSYMPCRCKIIVQIDCAHLEHLKINTEKDPDRFIRAGKKRRKTKIAFRIV